MSSISDSMSDHGALSDEVRALVEALGLTPHPEGGFYRETFRAPLSVPTPAGNRAASTAIYYLLPAGAFSALHRVRSDEVWHHYDGDPVELHTIDKNGTHGVRRLGRDRSGGERPQHAISAGTWQAAVQIGNRFSLCGCTVAPGFDFADFEMPPRADLVKMFPQHRLLLDRLIRKR
jgi:uncharacterized protein